MRPADNERRSQPVPLPDWSLRSSQLQLAAGCSADDASTAAGTYSSRNSEQARRASRADYCQDESAGRSGDDRGADSGFTGWRINRPDCARLLLPARWRARAYGEYSYPLDHRALPRAFAHLLLRE